MPLSAIHARLRARLESFAIERFKSFQSGHITFHPLTLLIGANASGKSNLIEGIRLLSWLAHGQRLDHVFRSVKDDDLQIRGRVEDMPYYGSEGFQFRCRFAYRNWRSLHVSLDLVDSELRIVNEWVGGDHENVPLYKMEYPAGPPSHDSWVAYNNFMRGRNKPQITCIDQQLILTQLQTPARFGAAHFKSQAVIPRVSKAFSSALANILFLDPSPRRMREYTHKLDKSLMGDGSNLSGVLNVLCSDEQGKRRVLEFVRDLPEQDILDITFVETPRGEVMLSLTESFGGKKQKSDAPILSDGTLRVLSIAAAVLSAPEGSLVVIEEIDNGVHPSRAKLLLKNIKDVATERSLSVLLTSHNPSLLDALPDDAVPHVACCYRDPDDGSSKIIHLHELDRYPSLIAQGPVGRLMTQGILDRFLKDQRNPEEVKASAQEWLEKWSSSEP